MLTSPAPSAGRTQVIQKPAGSFSASIALDTGTDTFYVTDSGNGQVKAFALADVINAFNTATPLDWNADGVNIGTPFQYPLGGVSGFTAAGDLVMGGFGAIVEVDPGSSAIVKTIDPAGTGPFYSIIYNDVNEDLIAIQSDFPNPNIIHTTAAAAPSTPAGPWWLLVPMLIGTYLYVNRRASRVS